MEVREFHPYDLPALNLQFMQAVFTPTMTVEHGMALKEGGESFTATIDGNPIACIGLIEHWPKRRYVWAYLAECAKAHNRALLRAIRIWLRYHGTGRIETAIDPRFEASIRWAQHLGFEREGILRHWTPQGDDWLLFSRVDRG